MGCGAFRLDAQERGTSLELVAFDRYFRTGLPKVDRLRFVVYADENLRFAALKSGDMDMIEYVPWQSMAAVESDPGSSSTRSTAPSWTSSSTVRKAHSPTHESAGPSPMP